MAAHSDITAIVRHWAPVRLRHRAGLPERIGFDPMATPVRIRAVPAEALDPRALPLEALEFKPPATVRVFAFEGTLWRRLRTVDKASKAVSESLEDGLAILAGTHGMQASPFRPRLPAGHRLAGHPGDTPIPPRALARASEALHEVAERRVRLGGERELVHDGGGIYAAIDQPLLPHSQLDRASLSWRDTAEHWSPMYRHDRPGDAEALHRLMGKSEHDIGKDRLAKARMSALVASAMEGIEVRDDDLRRLVLNGSFLFADCLSKFEEHRKPPGAEQALAQLCTRATIDAVDADVRSLLPLFLSVTRDGMSTIRGAEHNDLRGSAFMLDRYMSHVIAPRLAAEHVPAEDMEALGHLTP